MEYATFDGSVGENIYIAQMGTAESSGEESSEGCGATLVAPAGLVLLLSVGIAPAFLRRRER
jgi:hypothetical protein